jgi:hypothetical protein
LLIRTSIPYKHLLHTNTTTAHGHGTPHGPARPPRQPRTRYPPPPPRCHLTSTDVPQPTYVYGLLLGEFQVTIPPSLFTPYIPPTSTPLLEARKHLDHAAYLNYAPAQYKVGHVYEFAQTPFPFDALLNVQYYSLANQQGEVEADMALSKWFLWKITSFLMLHILNLCTPPSPPRFSTSTLGLRKVDVDITSTAIQSVLTSLSEVDKVTDVDSETKLELLVKISPPVHQHQS